MAILVLIVAVVIGAIAFLATGVRNYEVPNTPLYPPKSVERNERIRVLMERIHRENDFTLRFLGSYSGSDAAKKWKAEYVAYLKKANALALDFEEFESSQYMSEETSSDVEHETALLNRIQGVLDNLERLRDSDEAAEWQG